MNPHMVVLQYALYTIMVLDEWRNDIPMAFFVTSCTREQYLQGARIIPYRFIYLCFRVSRFGLKYEGDSGEALSL